MTEIDTMARTVWGESRGEGEAGMAAVAWVIRNRAAKPGWWGGDIETVCRKPWQFSCWNPHDPNSSKCATVTDSDPCFADALRICAAVMGGHIPDPTAGATSYYERHMSPPPRWADGKLPCAIIGNHLFFRG